MRVALFDGCPCASPLAAHHPPLGRGWRLLANFARGLADSLPAQPQRDDATACQDNFVPALVLPCAVCTFSTTAATVLAGPVQARWSPASGLSGATTLLLQLNRYPPPSVWKDPSLTTGGAESYNTQINDVLLTALVRALPMDGQSLSGSGHGREEIFDDVDVCTVGWFTTLFPVLLNLGGVASRRCLEGS